MHEPIVMYGADWCSDCRRSKAFLTANDIEFTYVDLEDQPEAVSTVISRNNGLRSIPVVVFGDGTHLTEPSNDELRVKLGLD